MIDYDPHLLLELADLCETQIKLIKDMAYKLAEVTEYDDFLDRTFQIEHTYEEIMGL